jgi:hypothetical protein
MNKDLTVKEISEIPADILVAPVIENDGNF